MKKSATRSQKTATMVGVAHPAQEMVALNNSTNKPRSFITAEMMDAVTPILQRIDECLLNERRAARSIGLQLSKLKDAITSQLRKSGKGVSERRINGILNYFIRVRFKIKGSRLNEYMRLAERADVCELGDAGNFSVSALIEFSRLDVTQLAVFMEKHPVDELKSLPIKAIKKLVRDSNGNSRNTVSKNTAKIKEPESQQAWADSLRIVFSKVTGQLDAGTELDKNLESVLMDISFWYIHRKRAA